jgi:hypothetical protein
MLRTRLAALLRVFQLEVDGHPVEIDGFRLRRPQPEVPPCGR